jgi:hypothetical protein
MLQTFFDRVREDPAILVSTMKANQLRVWIVILLFDKPLKAQYIKRKLSLSIGLIERCLQDLADAEAIRETPEGWVRVRTITLDGG